MKVGVVSAVVLGLALGGAAMAQEGGTASAAGQHLGGGVPGAFMYGLEGKVTEAAADHYILKTDAGVVYTVRFSANTHFVDPSGMHRTGEESSMTGSTPTGRPKQLQPSQIKVGDSIAVIGQLDPHARTMGAMSVIKMDPQREKAMREMHANYGKTWLQGKVTGVAGGKITLTGALDHAEYTFVVDAHTQFRMHRQAATASDIHVGDIVRAEGGVQNGSFTAASVMVMRMPRHITAVPFHGGATPSQPSAQHPQ